MNCVSRREGILISGFENWHASKQKVTWNALMDLVAQRKAPLRVDRVKSDDGKTTLVYVRQRNWKEFFLEKIVPFVKDQVDRENEARAAIAHALDPYFNKRVLALEKSQNVTAHQDAYLNIDEETDSESLSESNEEASVSADKGLESGSDDEAIGVSKTKTKNLSLRIDRMHFQRLQAAVVESSPWLLPFNDSIPGMGKDEFVKKVELAPMHGLRKCPPGVSVVPFSPLSLICNHAFVDSKLSKASRYNSGEAFERIDQAYNKALNRHSSLLKNKNTKKTHGQGHLIPLDGLKHVENLYIFPDSLEADGRKRKQWSVEEWVKYYNSLFLIAFKGNRYGSVVLEPQPSYWVNEGGVLEPIWTDENLQGLACAVLLIRDDDLEEGKSFQSITLAITKAELRERMQSQLAQQGKGGRLRNQVSSIQPVQNGAAPSATSFNVHAVPHSTSILLEQDDEESMNDEHSSSPRNAFVSKQSEEDSEVENFLNSGGSSDSDS